MDPLSLFPSIQNGVLLTAICDLGPIGGRDWNARGRRPFLMTTMVSCCMDGIPQIFGSAPWQQQHRANAMVLCTIHKSVLPTFGSILYPSIGEMEKVLHVLLFSNVSKSILALQIP